MSETSTSAQRAPWTGSTVDYDEAIEAFARAQYEAMQVPLESDAERAALRAMKEARKRVEAAVTDMIAWSTSRAYREIQRSEEARNG
ncbi:MAG TPA: hypothetical protein VFI96_04220 [Longimicrobiaceae bacterium]|nr:hypothetical protein [Longimicrobiaceae bacterium]